jgi:TonB family protein
MVPGSWGAWWPAIVAHLWQTTIILAVITGLAWAMRNAPARILNALWWVGLVKLVVPLSLFAVALRSIVAPIAAKAAVFGLAGITVWMGRAAPILNPGASAVRYGPAGAGGAVALVALWAAGAVWVCVLWSRSGTRSLVVRSVPIGEAPNECAARIEAAIAGTRIPRGAIRVTRERVTPVTIGIARRRIVIPEALVDGLTAAELRAVLLHEDAHRRRLEPLQVSIQNLAAGAFYFFPLLWPLLSRLRATSEMACDEAAVRCGVAAPDYARALARALQIGLAPAGPVTALAHGAPSLTRRRFERLRHEGEYVLMKRHWFCLAVAALAAAVVSFSGISSLATADEAQKAPAQTPADQKDEAPYSIRIVHMVEPAYPEDARASDVEGMVLIKIALEADGTLKSAEITQGVEGYPSLADAALEAVKQWTFEVTGDVKPDQILEVMVPVQFQLDGHSKDRETSSVTRNATAADTSGAAPAAGSSSSGE